MSNATIDVVSKGNRSFGFGIPKALLKYGIPIGLTILAGYLLVKNAGGIAKFVGTAASSTANYVGDSILNSLKGLNVISNNGTPLNSSGTTALDVQTAIKQAGLQPAPDYAVPYIAKAATLPSSTLDEAVNILLGKSPNVNLATNPDIITANNALISQLSQNAAYQLTGQQVVGLFNIRGQVLPLTQDAVNYYKNAGVTITPVVIY